MSSHTRRFFVGGSFACCLTAANPLFAANTTAGMPTDLGYENIKSISITLSVRFHPRDQPDPLTQILPFPDLDRAAHDVVRDMLVARPKIHIPTPGGDRISQPPTTHLRLLVNVNIRSGQALWPADDNNANPDIKGLVSLSAVASRARPSPNNRYPNDFDISPEAFVVPGDRLTLERRFRTALKRMLEYPLGAVVRRNAP